MNTDQAWKLKEKIVTIIERHLGNNTKVERDKNLPVRTSQSKRTRQCDVVITEGKAPRETISIVEVQKRGSKPDINTFEGWVVKMQQVGAQHLICVSELGFPKSIIERADELGPTIRLLTLKHLEEGLTPFSKGFFAQELYHYRYDQVLAMEIVFVHLIRGNPNDSDQVPNPFDKIFRINGEEEIATNDLLDWHFFKTGYDHKSLPTDQQISVIIDFTNVNGLEHKTFDGTWIGLRQLKIHLQLFITMKKMTWQLDRYEQLGWGELGWVARGLTIINGKEVHIVIPIKKVGENEYSFGQPISLGEMDTFISLGKTNLEAKLYSD